MSIKVGDRIKFVSFKKYQERLYKNNPGDHLNEVDRQIQNTIEGKKSKIVHIKKYKTDFTLYITQDFFDIKFDNDNKETHYEFLPEQMKKINKIDIPDKMFTL